MEIKDKIKELRRVTGISQYELADNLKISRSVVAKWETGRAIPSAENIELIAEYFNIDKGELFCNTPEKNNKKSDFKILISLIIVVVIVISTIIIGDVIKSNNYKKMLSNFIINDGSLILISEEFDYKTVTIPSKLNGQVVTSIGRFDNCEKLEKVILPDTITNIERGCFKNCINLENIEHQDSILTIGEEAFFGCVKLEKFIIPSKLTEIKRATFEGCENLKTVNLPDEVTIVEESAFKNCSSMKGITFSNKLTKIGDFAFSQCFNLVNIELPNSVVNLGRNAFTGCKNLKKVILSENLRRIKYSCFLDCYNLEHIAIPHNVTTIEGEAFARCLNLKTLLLNENLEEIGERAFEECLSLEKIDVFDNVEYIAAYAFAKCPKIQEFNIIDAKVMDHKVFGDDNPLKDYFYLKAKNIYDSNKQEEDQLVEAYNIFAFLEDYQYSSEYANELIRKVAKYYLTNNDFTYFDAFYKKIGEPQINLGDLSEMYYYQVLEYFKKNLWLWDYSMDECIKKMEPFFTRMDKMLNNYYEYNKASAFFRYLKENARKNKYLFYSFEREQLYEWFDIDIVSEYCLGSGNIKYLLEGSWVNDEDRKIYLTFKEGQIDTNLPTLEGDFIVSKMEKNDIYCLYQKNSEYKKTYTLMEINPYIMKVYCHADGKTYLFVYND